MNWRNLRRNRDLRSINGKSKIPSPKGVGGDTDDKETAMQVNLGSSVKRVIVGIVLLVAPLAVSYTHLTLPTNREV